MIIEDAKKMNKISSGDEIATRQIVNMYLNYVISIAFRIIYDREEAEDIAQEVFIKLWKQAKNWHPKAKISTWLYSVTRNACLNRLKKKKPILSQAILDTSKATGLPEPFENEKEKIQISHMKKILKQIPEKYRLVLTAFYFENLKTKEAAKIFNLSEDAYESMLRRARAKLKHILKEDKIMQISNLS